MDINGQDLIRACSAIGAGLAVIAGIGPGVGHFYFSFIRSDSILRFAAEDYRAAIQPTERRVKVVSTGIYIFV